MSMFDEKWQQCVRRARQATSPEVVPSVGFAARVVARWRSERREEDPAWIWGRLGLRALAGVTALLLILAALEFRDARAQGLGFPHLERAVAQSFWLL